MSLPLSPSWGLWPLRFQITFAKASAAARTLAPTVALPDPPACQLATKSTEMGWGFLTHRGSSSAGGCSQPPVLTLPVDSLPSQIREYGLVHLFSSALTPHSTTFILRYKSEHKLLEVLCQLTSVRVRVQVCVIHFLMFTLRTWMAES